MYRAFGLEILDPAAFVSGADQSLHVLSGLSELPVLVRNKMPPPLVSSARQEMCPHCATVLASCTGAS